MLASASVIRGRILEGAGVAFIQDSADVDEAAIRERMRTKGAGVEDVAMALAEAKAKAQAVAGRHPGALVIGADQILEMDGCWFEKPVDATDAAATLRALCGRTHRLVTAVAVACDDGILWRHGTEARLTMREFSDGFLEQYIAEGSTHILASVGAYRLEQKGAQLFTAIEGDYFTILGLPLLPLLEFLRRAGVLAG